MEKTEKQGDIKPNEAQKSFAISCLNANFNEGNTKKTGDNEKLMEKHFNLIIQELSKKPITSEQEDYIIESGLERARIERDGDF